ncbi:MAG: RES domain-containing protein [Actinomycetota bacterium]|nr:RES domain-containing protein [Actinomycetota bacterium]
MAGTDFVCLRHVNDDALASRVREFIDDETTCDLCQAAGAVAIDVITNVVRTAIYERFKPAQDWNAPWDEIESGEESRVYDLGELLDGELGLFDAVDEDLYEAIDASFGSDTMWVTTFEYDMRPRDKDVLGWSEFRSLVQHKSRYLQLDEQSFVAKMYGVPSPRGMLHRVAALVDRHQLYRTIGTDQLLWRGRVDDRRRPKWGPAELASAPARFARQSRMSAAGISMFYGALDVDTVAAELAGDARRWLMAGAFRAARSLRVIDLTELPPFPSPFAERAARRDDELLFLREFCDDVSRPVLEPELVHVEYAPTQVVTEYLRYAFVPRRRKRPVDGIVYQSSRCKGVCVALFATHEQCLGGAERERLLRWAGRRLVVRPHPPGACPD